MLNEGSFATGSTSLSRDPSHLNVAGWRSLRRTPALPRNFRVLPSVPRPRWVRLSLICPGSLGPEVCAGAGPPCRLGGPGGGRWSRSPAPGAGVASPAPNWSSLHPVGVLQRCMSLASRLDGGREREPPPLLLPLAHLGIIKTATGKRRTAGTTGWLDPKHGPQLSQSVMQRRMVARYGNQVYCFPE